MQNVEWVEKRFNSKINKTPSNCWEWTGSRLPKGYGQFRALGEQYAHRVSYILKYRVDIDGLVVCHRCDNPPCVNPEHLFIGTLDDNMRDMVLKGRSKKGKHYVTACPQGHEYTEENTLVRREGARTCLICKRKQDRENQRRYRMKKATT